MRALLMGCSKIPARKDFFYVADACNPTGSCATRVRLGLVTDLAATDPE